MKHLFAAILFLAATFSQAQSITIIDASTKEPAALVNVISYKPQVIAVSNDAGQVDLTPFIGSDSIIISLLGFEKQWFSYEDLKQQEFIALIPRAFSLEEFVISGSKWRQSTADVPNKIVTISAKDVQFQNPQTAADLLTTSGQVYVQKSQLGGGSPMIRGFATNRVMLNVDGVRMNNAIFRGGNLQNVISIDPFAVENTEVIYGPGSVIYGSDAIGGVMSFYTLEPKFSVGESPVVRGNILARSSSANFEKTGHFDVGIGLKKWAFATSLSYSDYDDLVMGRNGPKDYLRPEYVERVDGKDVIIQNPNPRKQVSSGFSQYHLMQRVRYRPSKHTDLNYAGYYSATSDYSRYDRLLRERGGAPRSAEWSYGPQEWMMHYLRFENDNRNWLYHRMRVTLAYQNFKESRHDRDFQDSLRTNRMENVDALSFNVDMEQDFGERHEIYFGTEVILNKVGSKGTDQNIATGEQFNAASRYPNNATWNSYAIYLTDRIKVSDKWTVMGGARYSLVGIEAVFDTTYYDLPVRKTSSLVSALNGSLGATYRPSSSWHFYANAATGFRAPNVDDIGKVFDSEPGSVVVPNPNLKPEYAYNAEVGVSKIFGDVFKLDVSGFYTWLQDALVRRDYSLNGQDSILYDGELSRVQAMQNAASAYVYGLQLGLEVKLPLGLGLSSRINFQTGREELDDGSTAPLRHAAPLFGITRLTYKSERFRAEVNCEYNERVPFSQLAPSELEKDYVYALNGNGDPFSPGWYVLNTRVGYRIFENYYVSGGIDNILDLRYRPYSSGISAPGRNFIGMLKMSF